MPKGGKVTVIYMSFKGILRGAFLAFVITFLAIIILSLVTYFGDLSTRTITLGIYISVVFGVFLGSFMVARGCEKSVLLRSMLVSIIYLFVLIAISVIINRSIQLNRHFITMTCGILASGFLGALLGK